MAPSERKRYPAELAFDAAGRTMADRTKVSSAQIRAARALLNWSARQLSHQSGISQFTIHRAEGPQGTSSINEHSLAAIQATLERFGIEFLDDSGVRRRLLNGVSVHLSHTTA